MKAGLKIGLPGVAAALLCFTAASIPQTASAAGTGPTWYAYQTCYFNWESDGYASYTLCARAAWNQYCHDVGGGSTDPDDPLHTNSACANGNPFGHD